MVVLFNDQSGNVRTITPYEVEYRLITPNRPPTVPFTTHATDLLDYLVGEVRVLAPPPPATLPVALMPYTKWAVIGFNH